MRQYGSTRHQFSLKPLLAALLTVFPIPNHTVAIAAGGATNAQAATSAAQSPTPTTPDTLPDLGQAKADPAQGINASLGPSGPQAAAQVLAASAKPMSATEMVEQMAVQGLWESPGGKTPSATLYAAIIREISAKASEARFKKVDRGMFESAGPKEA